MTGLMVLTLILSAAASAAAAKGLGDFKCDWVEEKAGVTTRETWTGRKDVESWRCRRVR